MEVQAHATRVDSVDLNQFRLDEDNVVDYASRGRWNFKLKVISRLLLYTSQMVAFGFIVIPILFLTYDWGYGVSVSFLFGPALLLILYGACLVLHACSGMQALRMICSRVGLFPGEIALGMYEVVMFACVSYEAWALFGAIALRRNLSDLAKALETSSSSLTYADGEDFIDDVFNKLYFAVYATCRQTQTSPLMLWVEANCPERLSRVNCLKCTPYSSGQCAADQTECYSGSRYASVACPYSICRREMVSFVLDVLDKFMLFAYSFISLQSALFLWMIVMYIFCTLVAQRDKENNRLSIVIRPESIDTETRRAAVARRTSTAPLLARATIVEMRSSDSRASGASV